MARIIPDRSAAASVGAQSVMFRAPPADARAGVTHDNGTEFARHARLRDEPGMVTYFADPYASWQRASCENRNGMIRRTRPNTAHNRDGHGAGGARNRRRDQQPTPYSCSDTAHLPSLR